MITGSIDQAAATTNYFPPKSLRNERKMRFGKVAAFSGRALQLVGELHLLAAMHFARAVMACAPGSNGTFKDFI